MDDWTVTVSLQPCDSRHPGTVEVPAPGVSRAQAWAWTQQAYGYWGLVVRVVPATPAP